MRLMPSATTFPISSFCAEMVATCSSSLSSLTGIAIRSSSLVMALTAFSMPIRRLMEDAPATMFLWASDAMAYPRTVAVVVPSPAWSLVLLAASFNNSQPIDSNRSFKTVSRLTPTPSWITIGGPYSLQIATLVARGPRVEPTASVRVFAPRRTASRASISNLNSLAISVVLYDDVLEMDGGVLLAAVILYLG